MENNVNIQEQTMEFLKSDPRVRVYHFKQYHNLDALSEDDGPWRGGLSVMTIWNKRDSWFRLYTVPVSSKDYYCKKIAWEQLTWEYLNSNFVRIPLYKKSNFLFKPKEIVYDMFRWL